MGRVDDLVVVITGAAGGQGAAHAAALAAEGARVIATNEPKEPLPDGVVFRTLDVADEEHCGMPRADSPTPTAGWTRS